MFFYYIKEYKSWCTAWNSNFHLLSHPPNLNSEFDNNPFNWHQVINTNYLVKGSRPKNRIFYDNLSISVATYPLYCLSTFVIKYSIFTASLILYNKFIFTFNCQVCLKFLLINFYWPMCSFVLLWKQGKNQGLLCCKICVLWYTLKILAQLSKCYLFEILIISEI